MDIQFTREEKQAIVPKIKLYLKEELDKEVGNFDAEFLLDFFTQEIGPFFLQPGYLRRTGDTGAADGERRRRNL